MTDENSLPNDSINGTGDSPLPVPGGNWLSRLRSRLGFSEAQTLRAAFEEALKAEDKGNEAFVPQERTMLLRMLRFSEVKVADAMVPRADIVAIEENAPLSELLRVFRDGGHSRIPVYSETLDDLRGMIHIKDLVSWFYDQATGNQVTGNQVPDPETTLSFDLAKLDLSKIDLSRPLNVAKIRRPVLFVPPSMPALNLFLRMQATRHHLALVIDEYGGTDGLISIEDLVEMIVGDIEDEHDDENEDIIVRESEQFLVAAARSPIADLEQQLAIKLIDSEDEEDFDTLGGLVFALAGHVPQRGEIIRHPSGLEFEILEADPRRIKRMRIDLRGLKAARHAAVG